MGSVGSSLHQRATEVPHVEMDSVVDFVVAVSDTEDEQFKVAADALEYIPVGSVPSFGEATRVDPYSVGSSLERVSDRCVDSACLLYTSPSPRDGLLSRMPSSA